MSAIDPFFEDVEPLDVEELRQRLSALKELLAGAPVPIAVAHDAECRFVSANRALASLYRLPEQANFSLTPPEGEAPLYRIQRDGRDLPSSELPMQYAIAHRTAVRNEIEVLCRDGTRLYVQNDVEPLYDLHGNVCGCISVCVDVTDRKLAEFSARDQNRRKDEFLATLSHELRNPLAPIRTALEVMRLAQHDPAVVERARATIERQLKHLVRLTDDLLDAARIARDKVHLTRERVDLRAAVQSALEATRPLIDAQALSLRVDLPQRPVWIDADLTRVSQALSNLLNNAAKYTPPGGEIRVTVTASECSTTVTVADNGIGIEPEMLDRIFEMFTQLQPYRDRTTGGLGIGLTLARRLIELHGGTIEARSEGCGRGTTFVVTVPTAGEPGRSVASGSPVAKSERPCRVLVADDNPDSTEMMREMFTLKGHDVKVAADGAQAVEIASGFRPEIAFLDIGMPRMDGYEAARRIRALLGHHVVLVALTGWGQDEDKRRSREAGFDEHLTKPPDPERLERLIDGCSDAAD
jgi:CheY-like chemotaxis protein